MTLWLSKFNLSPGYGAATLVKFVTELYFCHVETNYVCIHVLLEREEKTDPFQHLLCLPFTLIIW